MRHQATTPGAPWPVLVVDDDPDMHAVTELTLSNVVCDGRPLEFTHALSAAEARSKLANREFALALIDVVMESDDAGLTLIKHLRDDLGQHNTRIIVRTGQPGNAPEWLTVTDYDINGYEDKSMATAQRLRTAVLTALRAYGQIRALHDAHAAIRSHVNDLRQLIRSLSQADAGGPSTPVSADALRRLETLADALTTDADV